VTGGGGWGVESGVVLGSSVSLLGGGNHLHADVLETTHGQDDWANRAQMGKRAACVLKEKGRKGRTRGHGLPHS